VNTALSITVRWILVASLFAPTLLLAQDEDSASSSREFSIPEPQTPQELARIAYSDGVRAVKQADKYEAEAAKEQRADRKAKSAERSKKQYERARSYFVAAVGQQPTMFEAWNYVGYTSRKLGEQEKALEAYNEVLQLRPDNLEAMEYRGAACLTLNRLAEAKEAYITLLRRDRKLAGQLMAEMQGWIAARRNDPAGVSAEKLDDFSQWVTERAAVAEPAASLGPSVPTTPVN
jgi:tetratricopeptide (TPR) repeat protein